MIQGWHLVSPGWRWLYTPRGVSTPYGAVSRRGGTVFVPDLLVYKKKK